MSFPALDGLWQRPHHGRPRASRGWIIAAVAGSAVIGGAVSAYGSSQSRRAGRLTPAERHYMQMQQQREEEAYRFQQLMTPFMLEDMGLEADYENGQITRLRRRAKTPQEAQQDEIIDLAQKKVLKGLKGELDVDPQTERALAKNLALKKEQVRRAYGPGGDLGTGAQNALNLAEQSGNALRESVRRGEMSNADAMMRANIAQQSQDEQWRNQVARGLPFDSMRMTQASTPWDSYLGGAQRLGQQQDAAFYARLGGIIGGMGSMAGGFGGAGGAGAAAAAGGGGNTTAPWGDYF